MAHEILSVKLCELEEQFARLSSRIHLSETADRQQLQQEIQALCRECAETELTLQTKLQRSKAEIVSILADSYAEVEPVSYTHLDVYKRQALVYAKVPVPQTDTGR